MRLVGPVVIAAAVLISAGSVVAQNSKLNADEISKMLQGEQTEVVGANKLLEVLGGTGTGTATPQRVTRGVTPHAVTPKAAPPSVNLKVEFEFGKTTLTKSASTQLDELSTALKNPVLAKHAFEIAGHTDAKGSEQSNKRLSQQRAEAVVSFLEAKGVERDRLRALGKGEEELFDPADPLSAKNRRVEVRRLD